MRFNKIFLLLLLVANKSFGQITTLKAATKNESSDLLKYDSSKNFLGKDFNQYLGQDLYLKGKSESLREYGYEGFFVDYHKGIHDGGVYKCCDSYNSKYSELEGKYFKVLEIIPHPDADKLPFLYGKKFFFKLQEKSSGDIVYYEYDTEFEFSFPFIVVGYFEKLKRSAVGKRFVLGGTKQWFDSGELDAKTGKPLIFSSGQIWECTDLTIEEKYYNLSVLLQDKSGQSLVIESNLILGPEKMFGVFTEAEATKYRLKFGIDTWNTILAGKVRIGMTKEMCKLSWGEPKKINETITSLRKSEQWVYDDNYLYFDNGKLTTIQ